MRHRREEDDVKKISAVAWITMQADISAREGALSDKVAARIFGAAQVKGERTVEEWDELFAAAHSAECTMAEAAEYGEE